MVLWVEEKKSHPHSTAGRCNRGNTTCWPYKWLHFLISQEKMRGMAIQELQQRVHTVHSLLNWFQLARHWCILWLTLLRRQAFETVLSAHKPLDINHIQDLISSTLDQNSPSPCKSTPGNIFMGFFFSLAACTNTKRKGLEKHMAKIHSLKTKLFLRLLTCNSPKVHCSNGRNWFSERLPISESAVLIAKSLPLL